MLYFFATFSAVMPMEVYAAGYSSARYGFGFSRPPPRESALIDSTPPAINASPKPAMMRSLASAIVCRPEEQKRLTVWPGTSSGNPARWMMTRAIW